MEKTTKQEVEGALKSFASKNFIFTKLINGKETVDPIIQAIKEVEGKISLIIENKGHEEKKESEKSDKEEMINLLKNILEELKKFNSK